MNQFNSATANGSINYKSIIDNAVMAILLCKPDGTILSANKAGCELFGYDETELKEKGRNGIIDLTPGLVEYINERTTKGSVKGEVTGIKKDKEKIPLEFTSTIYHDDNGETLTCNTLIDISERKNAFEELHQRQQLLEQAEASYQEIFNKTDNGIGIHELDSWK